MPSWRPPMLASLLHMPAEAGLLRSGRWVYERKLDGLRGLALREGSRVELWSRNRLSFTARFPELVAALAELPAASFLIDGEIVAFRDGRTSFELLQGNRGDSPPVFVAFDLLHLLGRDTTGLPIEDRHDLLRRAIGPASERLRLSEQSYGDPEALLAAACEAGWEGLVAKRLGSTYRSGRSPDWRKLKCSARQELVVGGWTEPSGTRTGFGALLVGYYSAGRLLYAGKVGTGFDEKTLRSLHSTLRSLEAATSPFEDVPRLRGVHWARPELVAEIEFTEWTRDGRLRHPRYLGLRPDKDAAQVRRES